MTVPFAFANLSGNIALSKLDSNFNTPITIGNTSVQLGGTITTLNNMTLSNVTISGGTNNVTETLANVTTLNATSAFITTGNISTANVGNLTLLNALTVPNGGTGMVTLPANSVLLGNGTSPVVSVAPGTAGNVLTSIGGVWTSNAAVVGGGVSSVTASSPVSSSGGTTPNISFISPGTAGNVLTSIGGVWVSNAAVGGGGGGVTSISFGSTGLTPSTATTGVVSVAGTLSVVNGGTGLATIPALSIPVANSANTYTTVTAAAGESVRVNAGGTAWETFSPSVSTTTWGGVGSYAVCYYVNTSPPTLAGGSTCAGSLLYYCSGTTGISPYSLGIAATTTAANYYMLGTNIGSIGTTSLGFSGTWRCMAMTNVNAGGSTAQLFVRIS